MFRRSILASILALLAAAAPAGAAAPARWGELASEIGRSWAQIQNSDGTFPDYTYGGGPGFCRKPICPPREGNPRYGESILGYSLLLTGTRTRDETLIHAGLRAVTAAVRNDYLQRHHPTVFENLSVASAYNLARRRVPDDALFKQVRPRWEAWLKRTRPAWIGSPRPYFNHHLVEAVGHHELFRSGLRSNDRRALLHGDQRGRMERIARKILSSEIPTLARETARTTRGEPGVILADRPDFPIAYQSLSMAFYARTIRQLGGNASRASRRLLPQLAHAAWLIAAPDGDTSYFGRSQQDSWTLPYTMYGAAVTAHLPGSDAEHDRRYAALAERAFARLDGEYGIGPTGFWITPGVRRGLEGGIRGLDPYAGGAVFTGHTLLGLEWAIEEAGRGGTRSGGALASDADGASVLGRGRRTFALVRHGDLWYAAMQGRTTNGKRVGDSRYDIGLVGLKDRVEGEWRDLAPIRPLTSGPPDSAGPQFVTPAGRGLPDGTRLKTHSDGATTILGDYKIAGRGRSIRKLELKLQPVSCGLRVSFPARAGETYEYSVFLRGTAADVTRTERGIGDATQAIDLSEPAQVALEERLASGSDPELVRARLTFAPAASTRIAVTICRR